MRLLIARLPAATRAIIQRQQADTAQVVLLEQLAFKALADNDDDIYSALLPMSEALRDWIGDSDNIDWVGLAEYWLNVLYGEYAMEVIAGSAADLIEYENDGYEDME